MKQGTTDQYVYFVAVDNTDLKTRETGITVGNFAVYYSINGGAATAMTTPTVAETDSTNMPGVYELLIDESGMTTLAAGDDTSELCLHITDSGAVMEPVTRVIEIYREETTAGNTLDVTATGCAGIDWANVEGQGTSVDLSATAIDLCDDVTTTATATAVTTVNGLAANVITATSIQADAITAAKIADAAIDAATFAAGAIDAAAIADGPLRHRPSPPPCWRRTASPRTNWRPRR
jgi:hypothetical protein